MLIQRFGFITSIKLVAVVLCFLSASASAQATYEEELIVTGIRGSVDEYPGITYTRKGDFLLLKLLISNDTRDEKQRSEEIYGTLKKAIQLAKKNTNIELSVIQNGFVIPLELSNHEIDLSDGDRPDTSEAEIRVKTTIPDNVNDPEGLLSSLKSFSQSIPVTGRVEVEVLDEIDVSIVNPSQYRTKILELVAADIKTVTNGLGSEYRVVLNNIDGPVQWVKSGSINLTLYIDYSYIVIPSNVSSVFTEFY